MNQLVMRRNCLSDSIRELKCLKTDVQDRIQSLKERVILKKANKVIKNSASSTMGKNENGVSKEGHFLKSVTYTPLRELIEVDEIPCKFYASELNKRHLDNDPIVEVEFMNGVRVNVTLYIDIAPGFEVYIEGFEVETTIEPKTSTISEAQGDALVFLWENTLGTRVYDENVTYEIKTAISKLEAKAEIEGKDKSTFYAWKQVVRMPHTLNEAVILQSYDWYPNRDECVKDAKRKFQDDFNVTKRVIVKKSRWTLSADEVAVADKMKLVENLLTLCYCIQLTKIIRRLSRELCFGCMFDSEGEQVHTCRDMPEENLVEKYFNSALFEVDNNQVHENWRKLLVDDSSLHDVCEFNLVPYQCKEYRDSQFKTPKWVDGVKERVVKMLKLDQRMSEEL